MPLLTNATHSFTLDLPVDRCLPLFTPLGEEQWAPGWAPHYVSPADGRTGQGMIFTTGEDEDFTIWTLVDWEPAQHYVRYVRVTPALRAGTVEVRCTALNAGSTLVAVCYRLSALTPAGERSLQDFEGAPYRAMIDSWKQQIDAALAR